MNFLRIALFSVILLTVNMVDAATFTVYNKGQNLISVKPMWSGRSGCYDTIKPGESRGYDSGFYKVYEISWVQKLPPTVLSTAGQTTVKMFKASIDIGVVNLGAKFEILNDGSYSYMFGVQGSGNGNATAVDDLMF